MCNSKPTQQSSSTSSTTPAALNQLQDIYSRISGAASQPYTPYTGELTAGLTEQQQRGISNLNTAATSGQPYFGNAANYATQAGANISPDQIQRYANPFTQSVIDATQRQFANQNAQQQQQLLGNAAARGALGGDRSAVAQAILAGQQQTAQAPVIAGLNQSNYQQALQAAQADRSAAANAAGLYGNLGTAAQNAALTGAQAQIGAGTLGQQTQQAADTAKYQQYLQQQAFPYQQAQFLASLGLPVATAMGSTSSGTTSQQTNPWSQIAGLGIAGAGLFLKDGGAVPHKADGGATQSPFSYVGYGGGYVPTVQMGHITPLQPTPAPSIQSSQGTSSNPWADATKGLTGLKGVFSSPNPGSHESPLEGLSASDYDPAGEDVYKDGGFINAIHGISHAIKRARGGVVETAQDQNGTYVPRFGDGGDISFDDRFNELVSPRGAPFVPPDESPIIPDPGLQRVSPEAVEAWRRGVDQPNAAVLADAGASPQSTPMAAAASPAQSGPATPMRVALPKQITGEDEATAEPEQALGYAARSSSPFSMRGTPTAAIADQNQQQFGKSLFGVNLNDKTRQALVAAGLAMAASRNPNFLGALGEGGLYGLSAYGAANKEEREAANQKELREQGRRRVDLEAQRIAQSAEQFSKNYGLNKDKLERELQPKYGVIGEEPITGVKRYGWIDPTTQKVTPDTSLPTTKAAVDANGDPLTGEAYLKSLPPDQAAIVKKIANYEIPASSLSTRGGHREQLLASASRYNPEFDAVTYPARSAAVKAFATGPLGNTMRSLDVAIDHLDTLDSAAKAMQNSDYKILNQIRNQYREQTGSELPGNFEAAKGIVGDEIVKAVIGAKGALGDREEAKHAIDAAKSPAQLAGVIRTYKQLMAGQLHGLKKQYEDTTGLKNFDTRLRPNTLRELENAAHVGRPAEVTAIPPAAQRETGRIYDTPKGKARWMGDGWQLVQ